MSTSKVVQVFISYAHADEAFCKELEKHLKLLQRRGLIAPWHDRRIAPGDDWRGMIDTHLEDADLVLLLVSSNFVASDYCWDVEMNRALQRHDERTALVVPIIVKPVDLAGAPFMRIQGLPRDLKPISTWADRDEAWVQVTAELTRRIQEIASSR